jgi:hypothetical protein
MRLRARRGKTQDTGGKIVRAPQQQGAAIDRDAASCGDARRRESCHDDLRSARQPETAVAGSCVLWCPQLALARVLAARRLSP